MNSDELPLFPTTAAPLFSDPAATGALFTSVLEQLADAVDFDDKWLDQPSTCDTFTVAQLRQHVLGWLTFFAGALSDPAGANSRPDPDKWELGDGQTPVEAVRSAATKIDTAIHAGVAEEIVVMSEARMAGNGVLAMALGEYLIHGWDLTVSTGRQWNGADAEAAAEPALAFLRTTVTPEYRGPDSGFFDKEVPVPDNATDMERLVCFAGRNPKQPR